jgi:hypothetical protein
MVVLAAPSPLLASLRSTGRPICTGAVSIVAVFVTGRLTNRHGDGKPPGCPQAMRLGDGPGQQTTRRRIPWTLTTLTTHLRMRGART